MAYRNGQFEDTTTFAGMLDTLTETRKAVQQVVPDIESMKTYIWPRGYVPSVTKYTSDPTTQYFDAPGFEPYLVPYLVDSRVKPKGAVIICPGGGYQIRSESFEGEDSAKYFNSQGYQAFVLNYRVQPYTTTESSLDLQRAIRYVRYNAAAYRIPEDKIVIEGSSAGGYVCIYQADEMNGYVQPSRFIKGYVSDDIDKVSADASAFIGCYTGVIPAWALTNPSGKFINPNFPATFLTFGNKDGMAASVMLKFAADAMNNDIPVEIHTWDGIGHGFGTGYGSGNTVEGASEWPELASVWLDKALIYKFSAYNDIDKSAAKDAIDKLVSYGVVADNDEHMFYPDNNITQADFITMVVKSLNLYITYKAGETSYQPYLRAAKSYGIISAADKIKATDYITNATAKVILGKALSYADKESTLNNKLITYSSGRKITRGKAAQIVAEFIDLCNN